MNKPNFSKLKQNDWKRRKEKKSRFVHRQKQATPKCPKVQAKLSDSNKVNLYSY